MTRGPISVSACRRVGVALLARVAVPSRHSHRRDRLDPCQVLRRELDERSLGVLLQVAAALRAGDGDDVVALREDPREGELGGRHLAVRGEPSHARDGYRSAVLVAYGTYWYPWFVRRLAERPANLWFMAKNLFAS